MGPYLAISMYKNNEQVSMRSGMGMGPYLTFSMHKNNEQVSMRSRMGMGSYLASIQITGGCVRMLSEFILSSIYI